MGVSMKIIFALLLLLGTVVPFASAKDLFKVVSIDELDSLIKSASKSIFIYDANVESIRTNVGIIPGARLIESDYDVKAVLPEKKDSKLFFYCANKMCTSSDQAAGRAMDAGYSDVSVLKEGIFGWKKAKKTIVQVNRTPQSAVAVSMEPKEVDALLKKNEAVIVDAREDEERFEVIAGALWTPMSKVSDQKFWNEFKSKLPKGKTVVFYCASGIRSKKLAERLAAEGLKSAYFKSVDQWKAAGFPAVKGPAR